MEIVLKYLGYMLLIFSVFPLVPVVLALYYYEPVMPFFASVLLSLALGLWLVNRRKNPNRIGINELDIPRSITLSALSFIALSVIGGVPYMLGQGTSFIDASFEAVSGFTTTGLSVYADVEVLPKSILFWRAETQWLGGIGIVIFFLVIVSAMRQQESLKETTTKAKTIATLYQAQGASEKLEANMSKSIRNTVLIYCTYTLIGILLLVVFGLTLFEAVATTFAALATGGFQVTNQFYTSWPVLIVCMFLMVAGAISFVVHNHLFRGELKNFLKNGVLRFYFLLIASFVLVSAFLMDNVKDAMFLIITAITTTGFMNVDINAVHQVVVFLVVCSMMIGGMIASTAGAIKVGRIRLMLKSIPWLVRKTVSPANAVIPLKIDGEPVDDENILVTHAFITVYILFLLLGTLIVMATGISFFHSAYQVVSALGTVGLSSTNVALFTPVAKVVLIVAMLLGRLEIFPLLAIGKFFYDRAKLRMMKKESPPGKLFYTTSPLSELWKKN